MRLIKLNHFILLLFLFISNCTEEEKVTFKDQIINDVTTKIGTGICNKIPANSVISNVIINEIIPVKSLGVIDVSVSFSYFINDTTINSNKVLLYKKNEDSNTLEAIGGCKLNNNLE